MKLAIIKERVADEKRVALTPEVAKALLALGMDVRLEAGAGLASGFQDEEYQAVGVHVMGDVAAELADADALLTVQSPFANKESALLAEKLPKGAVLIGLLNPYADKESLGKLASQQWRAVAMDLIPRISRAQSMDALSSQSNLAGYRAVIEGAALYGRAFPLMMTAAGTVPPAKVVILGAGVAGLQAIATAKRLGAVVSAFDVRPAVKEQVQSLGASFIEVEADAADAETAGGYAKEMSKDYQERQKAKIHEVLSAADVVISTALIPGKPAPVLIEQRTVDAMKRGSVIVDMAAPAGGNCAATKKGKVYTTDNGVVVAGFTNLPAHIAQDASRLYAKNLLALLKLMWDKDAKELKLDREDAIIAGALLTIDGKVVHPQFADVPAQESAVKEAEAKPTAEKTESEGE